MSSLDELLTYDDDRPARRRVPSGIRWWRLAGSIAVCAAVAYVASRLIHGFGWAIAFPLAFVLLVALVGLSKMIKAIGAGLIPSTIFKTPRPTGAGHVNSNDHVSGDAIRDGVKHWEMRLSWTGTDAARFAATTQPALVELIDERLRLRHGVDRAADPDRARDLLGPHLWNFVNEPVKRRPTARDLGPLVAAMEAL